MQGRPHKKWMDRAFQRSFPPMFLRYRMTEPRAHAHCRMAAIRPCEDHFDGTTERGKSPSTISAALNGHRASQKRPRSSPLGPLTSTASGGEL